MKAKGAMLAAGITVGGIGFTIFLTQTILTPIVEKMGWFSDNGTLGIVSFLALYVILAVLLIPASFHKFVTGLLFGFWAGLVIAFAGGMIAAILPFLIAKRWLEPWTRKRIEKSELLSSVEKAVLEDGDKTVFLTRISLVLPYGVLNYVYGLTRVSFKNYMRGNVGMFVPAILYAWWGSQAAGLAEATQQGRDWTYWFAIVISAIITILVIIHLRKLTLKHLDSSNNQHISE